ncbi:MAG: phytanoyl-CoA dioxygenase family protein [Gammaproteobacteria bacterium]|nr:phytanoyl-CoA dioxygenase family protein [Gammaproteobacteria bacterium]
MKKHGIELVNHTALEPWLEGRPFDEWKAQYDEEGYAIFEAVMTRAETERVRDALQSHLSVTGRNHFEGYKSHRVYSLLAKAPDVFSDMITHPLPLAFAEAELGASCLISGLLAINLLPGETAQGWHYDDAQIRIPRPRPAYGVSAFWTIDDTTEMNGATEIIPRSHLWGDGELDDSLVKDSYDPALKDLAVDADLQPRADAVKATMPAGSLMITKGTLWHRGGANRSSKSRLVITPQYCPGWARQLENMMLAVPAEIAATLPKRTRQLLGYNIHDVFMGYVDGVHPDTVLNIGT